MLAGAETDFEPDVVDGKIPPPCGEVGEPKVSRVGGSVDSGSAPEVAARFGPPRQGEVKSKCADRGPCSSCKASSGSSVRRKSSLCAESFGPLRRPYSRRRRPRCGGRIRRRV